MSSDQPQYPQSPHDGHGGWEPLPRGEYDADATAFVQLPDGLLDDLASMRHGADPLAAPGHGYVPPPITPAAPAVDDPGAPGSWTMPFAADGAQAAQWPPSAEQAAPDGGWSAPGTDGGWSIPAAADDVPDDSGEYSMTGGTAPYGGVPSAGTAPWNQPQDTGTDPSATGQWSAAPAQEAVSAHPYADPGSAVDHPDPYAAGDVTGTWDATAHDQWPASYPAPDTTGSYPHQEEAAGGGHVPGHTAAEGAGWPEPAHDAQAWPAHDEDQRAGEVPETFDAGQPEAPVAPEPHAAAHDTAPAAEPYPDHRVEAHAEHRGEPYPDHQGDPYADHRGDAVASDGFVESAPEPQPHGAPVPAATGPEALVDDADARPADAPSHSEHPYASYVLNVNGTDRPVTEAWVGESLLYVLRERLGLAGAKDGCSQGECGACSVQVDGRLVASCLVPAATATDMDIRTVEGLAADGTASDVQRALAARGAVQCGFCVPGLAMTVHDLLEGNHAPTELQTRQAICGNLCRCSGYRGVLEAVREVVETRARTDSERADPSDPARTGSVHIPHQAGPHGDAADPSTGGPA